MSSLKCAQCGLVNFATAIACKRCKQPLVVSSTAEGIVLSDGYVLPPPPNVGLPGSGVWRDKSKRQVGVRLEQFREVFSRLFTVGTRLDSCAG